jgi:hypothetical protein
LAPSLAGGHAIGLAHPSQPPQIGVHHHLDELFEIDGRRPVEFAPGFGEFGAYSNAAKPKPEKPLAALPRRPKGESLFHEQCETSALQNWILDARRDSVKCEREYEPTAGPFVVQSEI